MPSFRKCSNPLIETSCKCGREKYLVPNADSVPLVLRDFSEKDIHFPRPFDIHCGEYHRMVHGYHQRTGPFRVTWSALSVTEKIELLEDGDRRRKLQRVYQFHAFYQMEQYLNERSALAESFGILADVMYGFHVF